jgi:surface carbohydrate biosynthesis protein
MTPRVALIVDHPARDLGGLAWIAVELARRGVEALLIPMQFQESDLLAAAPDLVVVNYLRRPNQPLIDKLIACRIRFVLLDTEGGFYGDLRHYFDTLPHHRAHYDAMSTVLAWGGRMREFWTRDIGLAASKVRVTGQPRFDYYTPRFHTPLRRFLPAQLRDSERPMILLNTKVSVANPRFLTPEQEFDLYVNRLQIPREAVERHLRIGREAITATCRIAESMAQAFPDADVVIRPHPHERLATYVERCKPFPNLTGYQEGEVAPWLVRSSVLLQRHCTTAIEAALAGKPVVAPQWWPTSANLPDAEALSYTPQTPAELAELVSAAAEGKLAPREEARRHIQGIIDAWLYQVDGQSAARVADAVVDLLPDKRVVDERRARQLAYAEFGARPGFKAKAYGLLARYVRPVFELGEDLRRRKWMRSGKGFSVEEVRAYAELVGADGIEVAPLSAGAVLRARAARPG